MKRILIFSLNYYPRFIGGAEVAIKEITDRILPEEIEFHMVTLRFDSHLPKVEKIGNVTVHRIGFSTASPTISDLQRFPLFLNKYWYQFMAAMKAAALHRQYHFDGTWAMMAHSCGIPAGIFKTFHPEVKYLLTLQEGDSIEYIEKLMKPIWLLFKRGFTQADALQSISNFLLAWGRRMGFTGDAEVIPNAVDTKHFTQTYLKDDLSAMRDKIGKKLGDVYLVTTSRLVHKNAVDDVIRAIALLPENIHFLIYGIGPDEAPLKKLVDDLGVVSRVHFAGQIGHTEMPLALKACDIFIRPSRSEGMGNSFIEAMAAELPVIATQEGGIADFLFDAKRNPDKSKTGWAVDVDSPEQIAAAVQDILAHPEQVERVKATAKNMVLESYDWNIITSRMQSVFQKLLPAHGPLTVLSLNLDTRILDPHSAIAERERAVRASVQIYTLLVPYTRDVEVPLTDSSTAYGVGGSSRLVQLVRLYRKAVELMRWSQYDVLTVQDTYYLALVGWCIARRYDLGFEIQVHGFEKFSGVRALLAKILLPRADAIRVASSRLKDLLVSQFKIPEERITIAPLFFETKQISPSAELIFRITQQKGSDFIFLTTARLVPIKNILLQIQAFKNLVVHYPDTQLWIVGDGPEREMLEKIVRKLSLSDRVLFWGWQSELSAFYTHADSYLLSSDSEGWGLVIFEAATYGLPILMTDVGCAGEFIQDGRNGLIVPPRAGKAFEAGMTKLRADAVLRESLGQAAQDSGAMLPSREELIQKYVSSWGKAFHTL
jgi:glycosyltransferase involved in cell wall biosynthesis